MILMNNSRIDLNLLFQLSMLYFVEVVPVVFLGKPIDLRNPLSIFSFGGTVEVRDVSTTEGPNDGTTEGHDVGTPEKSDVDTTAGRDVGTPEKSDVRTSDHGDFGTTDENVVKNLVGKIWNGTSPLAPLPNQDQVSKQEKERKKANNRKKFIY